MREKFMAELNLTPAQQEHAKGIFRQARVNAQPYRTELRQNREQLAAAIKANDTAKIDQLSMQRGRIEGHLAAIHSGAMAKFYSTLTPAQKVKADQIHQRMEQRMKQHQAQRTPTQG
jgi:Spy/CpxP family protein refolding chaperone